MSDGNFGELLVDGQRPSSTTMYQDYALDQRRFHWQSQSGTRPSGKKGQRHIRHAELNVRPLLFVRQTKKDDRGMTVPYLLLGPAALLTWSGERPMNIEWELDRPMPAAVLRDSAVGRSWRP